MDTATLAPAAEGLEAASSPRSMFASSGVQALLDHTRRSSRWRLPGENWRSRS